MAEAINVIRSRNVSQPLDASLLEIKEERWGLTAYGNMLLQCTNSPEVQVFSNIPEEGIPPAKLEKLISIGKKAYRDGFAAALKSGWIEPGEQLVTRRVESVQDVLKDLLRRVQAGEVPEEIDDLEKRELVQREFVMIITKRKKMNAHYSEVAHMVVTLIHLCLLLILISLLPPQI